MNITYQKRIQLALPPWWGTAHPTLDTIVLGYAAGFVQVDAQIEQLKPLMRLNTVTGDLLDIAAYDFLGTNIIRSVGESDNAYRARIKAALFQIYGVRSVFGPQVAALANSPVTIIDPRRPADTGILGNVAQNKVPTLFYNSKRKDCYTNFKMPYQWFLIVSNNTNLSNATLRVLIQNLMPAGTVCFTMITGEASGVASLGAFILNRNTLA